MDYLKTAINSIEMRTANIFPAIRLLMIVVSTACFAIALFIFWVKNAAVISKRWGQAQKLKTVATALFPIGLKVMTILSKLQAKT